MRRHLTRRLVFILLATIAVVKVVYAGDEPITLKFETNPYGLIFTNVEANGEPLLAMIDIGDQQRLQIAATTAEGLAIPLEKTGFRAGDINGNQWDVYRGTLNTFKLGKQIFSDVSFTSSRGDIEGVAEQISTDFEAVIGWGFLRNYIVEFDYTNKRIRLYEQQPQAFQSTMTVAYEDQYGPLIFDVLLAGKIQRVMLDTGASASVFDPQWVEFSKDNEVNFTLGGEAITLTGYEQNLAMLADLKVVGILGSDLLHLYKVIINPFSHQVHFVKYG